MEHMSIKDELMAEMTYAIQNETQLFAVRVYFADTGCYETIINTRDNFKHKLDYYNKTYNSDLVHSNNNNIRIIDFTAADCYSDVETAFDF